MKNTTSKYSVGWKQCAAYVIVLITVALTPLYGVQPLGGVSFAQVSLGDKRYKA